MAMLPVEEALKRIVEGLPAPRMETIPIIEARGRVLADDLQARLTQPPFDASAMDGYAVRADDAARTGARLRVIGTSQAGLAFAGSVAPGEAARIFTGAPMPLGADTVIIQENVRRDDDGIIIEEPAKPGANVRGRGIDFAEGAVLLQRGHVLDAHAMSLAAAMGHGEIAVLQKPVIAILATGDELVPPGTTPGPDQIVSSNPVGIAALVEEAGGVPQVLGIARDTADAIAAKVAEARSADVLVTIGGASVGDYDLVVPVLEKLGMELEFWKVAIRPGKPLLYGRLGAMRVMGVPGNPASALICARVFLMPLIRALGGRPPTPARREMARLTVALEANGPRLQLMRATLSDDGSGMLAVTPARSQDSSLLSALATADCLIRRAPHALGTPVGTLVEIERT